MQEKTLEIIVNIAVQYLQMRKFAPELKGAGISLGDNYWSTMVQPELIASISA